MQYAKLLKVSSNGRSDVRFALHMEYRAGDAAGSGRCARGTLAVRKSAAGAEVLVVADCAVQTGNTAAVAFAYPLRAGFAAEADRHCAAQRSWS